MIEVRVTVTSNLDKVWVYWNEPQHSKQWNMEPGAWVCYPTPKNELRTGGNFSYRLETIDGSDGFDFLGNYEDVKEKEYLSYVLQDQRKVVVTFQDNADNSVTIIERFDPDSSCANEMQQAAWQSILGFFKDYVENN